MSKNPFFRKNKCSTKTEENSKKVIAHSYKIQITNINKTPVVKSKHGMKSK